MALGNRAALSLDTIECVSCMDNIDWEETSKALGKVVTMASYIEKPRHQDSLRFVPKGGAVLTRFTLQRPPAKVIDVARSDGREDSLGRQAFWLALRSIRKIEHLFDDEEEHPIKWQNEAKRMRITGVDSEKWNRTIHEDLQNKLGNNTLTELGLTLLLLDEQGEDENF